MTVMPVLAVKRFDIWPNRGRYAVLKKSILGGDSLSRAISKRFDENLTRGR